MKRRDFVIGAGPLLAALHGLDGRVEDDVEAVKKTVRSYYSVFYTEFDRRKYRALLTDDYLLLENGDILDADADIALMPAPDSGYRRTDAFDFRAVRVHGDSAYAVYILKSDIKDQKGTRRREWLESSILRRAGSGWRVALLHSTRTNPQPG